MSKFIWLETMTDGAYELALVNIGQICVIWEYGSTIVVSGSHGMGNGLLQLTTKSMQKLISEIEKGNIV